MGGGAGEGAGGVEDGWWSGEWREEKKAVFVDDDLLTRLCRKLLFSVLCQHALDVGRQFEDESVCLARSNVWRRWTFAEHSCTTSRSLEVREECRIPLSARQFSSFPSPERTERKQ